MDYIFNQFQHFNLIQFILTTFVTVTWTKYNTTKEIQTLTKELYNAKEELKDEIREGKQK